MRAWLVATTLLPISHNNYHRKHASSHIREILPACLRAVVIFVMFTVLVFVVPWLWCWRFDRAREVVYDKAKGLRLWVRSVVTRLENQTRLECGGSLRWEWAVTLDLR